MTPRSAPTRPIELVENDARWQARASGQLHGYPNRKKSILITVANVAGQQISGGHDGRFRDRRATVAGWMFLVISTSLSPTSRSRVLARQAVADFARVGRKCRLVDLQDFELPICDAAQCYSHPHVQKLSVEIRNAQAVLICSPVYNYDLSSSAKNLIELTGQAWLDKIVGFLVSAGGRGSFMSVMGLANSLMLDFRTWIVPRFVYVTEDMIEDDQIVEQTVAQRIQLVVADTIRIAEALYPEQPEPVPPA